MGTVEEAPVRFRVRVEAGGDGDREVLERTVTRPHRWEPAPVDLSAWAGREVTLALTVDAEAPGAVGFWGAPVVRGLGRSTRRGPRRGTVIPATRAFEGIFARC